jgi:gas vesicle protein
MQLTEYEMRGMQERQQELGRAKNKMRRIFLIGVLCGVIVAAAVTFVFAIPGNSDYWRMEIWKRGGAAWCFDKNGKISWAWTVKPNSETHPAKRMIKPSPHVGIQSERL